MGVFAKSVSPRICRNLIQADLQSQPFVHDRHDRGKHGAAGVHTALLSRSLLPQKQSHFLFPLRSMIT
jgi:hypothetical protein